MSDRPDYPDHIKCVLTGVINEHLTWCGRIPDVFEWTFQDASHAALNGKHHGRLLTCPQCRDAIIKAVSCSY